MHKVAGREGKSQVKKWYPLVEKVRWPDMDNDIQVDGQEGGVLRSKEASGVVLEDEAKTRQTTRYNRRVLCGQNAIYKKVIECESSLISGSLLVQACRKR